MENTAKGPMAAPPKHRPNQLLLDLGKVTVCKAASAFGMQHIIEVDFILACRSTIKNKLLFGELPVEADMRYSVFNRYIGLI